MLAFFCHALTLCAQDTSHNYVKTVSPLDSVQQSCMVSVLYFDGLGRPVQTVSQSLNPYALTRRHVEYDGNGRKSDIWPVSYTHLTLPTKRIV